MNFARSALTSGLSVLVLSASPLLADENLLGYIKGAEPLPEGASEIYGIATHRWDKGAGDYAATDYILEAEHGFTNRMAASLSLKAMSLDTQGLLIDGYMPKDEQFAFKASGIEGAVKYSFLTPAKDDIGLAAYVSLNYDWIDSHSGQDKDKYSLETKLLEQQYFLDGQLVWINNLGVETTYAKRAAIGDLPDGFDWPTEPEMEIEFMLGTGLSYRFAPNWSIGAEVFYETEFETEVGTERWSVHGGPSLHYGARDWWATLTWLPQLSGGGEKFDEQDDTSLHLIEKTKQEVRLKVGFNF